MCESLWVSVAGCRDMRVQQGTDRTVAPLCKRIKGRQSLVANQCSAVRSRVNDICCILLNSQVIQLPSGSTPKAKGS